MSGATANTKTEIPTLDYWMLNIISDALQKEYNKRSKDKNLNAVLAQIAKEDGLDKAKAVKAEVDSNRWDNVGQVACCMQRIEEIKEAITLAVKS
jgi:predicted DsbA family dithiol-disulfide isomerase